MSRTKGSGWGAGPMLYQVCPGCGQKKCYYDPLPEPDNHYKPFRCLSKKCTDEYGHKKRYNSDTLIRQKHPRF